MMYFLYYKLTPPGYLISPALLSMVVLGCCFSLFQGLSYQFACFYLFLAYQYCFNAIYLRLTSQTISFSCCYWFRDMPFFLASSSLALYLFLMDWLTLVLDDAPSISIVSRFLLYTLSRAIRCQKGYRYGLLNMLLFYISLRLNLSRKCFLPLSTKNSSPTGIQDGHCFYFRLKRAMSGRQPWPANGLARQQFN